MVERMGRSSFCQLGGVGVVRDCFLARVTSEYMPLSKSLRKVGKRVAMCVVRVSGMQEASVSRGGFLSSCYPATLLLRAVVEGKGGSVFTGGISVF